MVRLACALVTLLLGGGGAAKHMETVLQDDAMLLHRSPSQVREAARTMAELGVDRVRITAGWAALSPEPRSREVPGGGFDASDPRTYPQKAWESLDTAVKAADDAGMDVQLDVAFWAPRWAVARGSSNPQRQRDRPSPELFADFAKAVARRYSGAYRDPADPRERLPSVRWYATWNEPNHPSFLQPQWVKERGEWRAYSPHLYRSMHNAAYRAINRVSPLNRVLLGNTASTGSTVPGRGGVPPLEFLRALACVDEDLERLRVRECRDFEPLRADGFAHHPYSRTTTPGTSSPFPGMAPIADTERLTTLLEDLADRGRIARRLPVHFTEYGYETAPPDPFQLYSPEQQARFLGWATYLAWREDGVVSDAQFLLRDIDPSESGREQGTRGYWRDFQTGLLYHDGRPKPAAQAFKLPFYAELQGTGDRRALMLFGGVRPGGGNQIVRVEAQDPATGAWSPVPTVGPRCQEDGLAFRTDRAGWFQRTAAPGAATQLRLARRLPDGGWETGPPIEVTPALG